MKLENENVSHENEQMFGNVFELAGVGIAELSIDGNFKRVNAPFVKIVGYSEEELKSMTFGDITYADDLEIDNKYVKELIEGKSHGYSLEKRYIKKDGTIVWVNLTVTLVYDKSQKPDYFLSVIHDINGKKQTEFELKKQAKALFYSPVSIIVTNKRGIIEYINPAFTRITGFTEEDVLGKNPKIQASGEMDKKFYKLLWETILKGELWRGTFINKKKDGGLYWEDAFISPVFDTENKITHFVAVKEDITDSIKSQQALLQAKQEAEKANQAKSIFIAHMSHEIRTPLNAILGFSQLLMDNTNISSDHKDKVKIIHKNGEHLLGMINEILEISKIEAGRVTLNISSFDIHALLEDIKNTFYLRIQEKGIRFEFIIESNLPRFLITDEVKLRQILINLVGNAVKFTYDGSVKIYAGIKNQNGSRLLYFSVKDTGVGIEEKDLRSIFNNFVQVGQKNQNEGGTGLGLAITRKFIEKLGGEITVVSTLGEGSDFSFYIPIKVSDFEALKMEDELTSNELSKNADEEVAATQLDHLPTAIKEQLKEALLEGDIDEIEKIIDLMSSVNSQDVDIMRHLSQTFQFDKLLKLLGK
ncbi:MAG: domain S-box protein [Clostridia bacterium]|jgi:PAS domain S-box-containing protein|nr:domain S-box protein [Clostridia bacterium]